jgi:hypothetical protein
MRRILSLLAVGALAMSASAQQPKTDNKAATAASASCPMSLTNLDLTAAQQSAFDSIRAQHRAEMTKLMPEHAAMMKAGHADMKMGDKMGDKMSMKMTMTPADSAAMEQSMKKAVEAMRTILTDRQRVKFDAAVAAHETKMAAAKKNGDDMMACCMECMKETGPSGAMKVKKPE